jgi:hypothetical protein
MVTSGYIICLQQGADNLKMVSVSSTDASQADKQQPSFFFVVLSSTTLKI